MNESTQKNLTLIFDEGFESVHLGKDVFLFPYYLGKHYGMKVHIVYMQTETNKDMCQEYRGTIFHPVKSVTSEYSVVQTFESFLRKHAKEIDVLMLFHSNERTERLAILYKILNRKGKCYVKLDLGSSGVPAKTGLKRNVFRLMRNTFRSYVFCKMVDYVSIETTEAFRLVQESRAVHLAFGSKLHYHCNGFDEEYLNELGIRVKSFEEKDNLLITVGQIGTYPKNTVMLLNALKRVELRNWKVAFIGPVDPVFEKELLTFYEEYPQKKNQVFLVGMIHDKKILWEYYNSAKVFCLTSDWESFALVLTEAYRFGNYIVSTPVGAYMDVVNANNVGESVPIKDDVALATSLQNIIDGVTDIDVYSGKNICQKYNMERIVREFEL